MPCLDQGQFFGSKDSAAVVQEQRSRKVRLGVVLLMCAVLLSCFVEVNKLLE